jgi:uncharacterized damage-inducible protein DinB
MAAQFNIQQRYLTLMQNTVAILGHLLKRVTPQEATTLRDGPNGWTVLEVVCHLRDFDEIFYQRALLTLEQDQPTLPIYDPDALAIERAYNQQGLDQAYADLATSRRRLVALFSNLTEEQWERAGLHPEYGLFTLMSAALHVSGHDALHLEQITRILTQAAQND